MVTWDWIYQYSICDIYSLSACSVQNAVQENIKDLPPSRSLREILDLDYALEQLSGTFTYQHK